MRSTLDTRRSHFPSVQLEMVEIKEKIESDMRSERELIKLEMESMKTEIETKMESVKSEMESMKTEIEANANSR